MARIPSRVAYVNLSNGSTEVKELDPELVKSFIGGPGVSFRLAYDLMKPGTDPLSPENPIIMGAGALAGTRIQAPKWSIVTRNPLNGAIFFGNAGMGFGVRLKQAGYDQVVISGRASKPVYLKISNADIELCDAGDLWGKDIYETTDTLWSQLGREYSVMAIGQAGEHLVKISVALVDKTSSIGKGGAPAVMASKNLKAVVVRGTKGVEVADPERFNKISGQLLEIYNKDPHMKTWVELGKMWFATKWNPDLKLTYRNFRGVFPVDRYFELYGEDAYLNEVKGKRIGCATCTHQSKDLITVHKGPYQGLTTNVSSLAGRVWNLGVQCAAGVSLGEVAKLTDVANRYGIDTHTFTPLMGLAVELYERGIITDRDTEGMVLKHDFDTTLALIEKTAFRQGIGNTLADGVYGVFDRFGKECEKYSAHIKGIEPQHVDARTYDFNMMLFTQVVNPQGSDIEAAHVGANWYPSKAGFSLDAVRKFCQRMGLSKEAVDRVFDAPPGHYNTARITPYAENFFPALSALGICEYRTEYMDWSRFAELYSSVTGIEMTADEMQKASDRLWNLWKALNVREGFDRKDDRFPEKWLQPLRTADGEELPLRTCEGRPVCVETFNKMLDEYYEERGWDIKKGIPTKEKLSELGLTDIAEDLQNRGFLK